MEKVLYSNFPGYYPLSIIHCNPVTENTKYNASLKMQVKKPLKNQ